MTNKETEVNHLSFLDGFRGFAAIWVIMSHSLILSGWSCPIIKRGDVAVDLFMIMSGFLMTYHYWNRESFEPWHRPKTWLRFYLRRFFRIAPLYYLLLIVSLLLGSQLFEWRSTVDEYTQAVKQMESRYKDRSVDNLLMHVTFLFGAFPRYSFSTPLPDWSIGLEMQFYLVFPFLVWFLRKWRYLAPVFVVLMGSFILTKYVLDGVFPMPSFLPLKISYFFIGMLLATAHHHKLENWNLSFSLIILIWAIVFLTYDRLIFVLSFLLMMIIFYDRKKNPLGVRRIVFGLENVLANRITKRLADMSYGAYLLHLLIMIPFGACFLKSSWYAEASGAVRFTVLLMSTAGPTYLLSWVLYKYVEQPGISFGKRLVSKYV